VTKLPVTKLVRKNSNNLLRLALLNKSIVDDNVLLPGETKEIGVGVGAALAAVDDVELVQGELEAGGKRLDLCLELAVLERRQLVEQGQDGDGVDGDHEDLEGDDEEPEVVEELVASLLDDLEEAGEEGGREDKGQELSLDEIRDEELGRLLVEAEFLLEDKRLVDGGRESKDLANGGKSQDEDDSMANLAREPRRRKLEEQITRPGPELGEYIKVHKGEVLELRV
jgi:hypothetical protein